MTENRRYRVTIAAHRVSTANHRHGADVPAGEQIVLGPDANYALANGISRHYAAHDLPAWKPYQRQTIPHATVTSAATADEEKRDRVRRVGQRRPTRAT